MPKSCVTRVGSGSTYGGATQTHFAVSIADIKPVIFTPEVSFIDLTIAGVTTSAIIKDMQFHPLTEQLYTLIFCNWIKKNQLLSKFQSV